LIRREQARLAHEENDMKRKIIEIDETLCNGCGNCITACAEGALKLVNGKARLVSDVYCDGLGACIGECPTGALTVVEREAPAFDEEAAARHAEEGKEAGKAGTLACGCPGSAAMTFDVEDEPAEPATVRSTLSHFPVKLQLIHAQAPYLKGADLLLIADCCALCYPGLHQNLLKGKAVAMGCPKLDDLHAHIGKLVQIVRSGGIASITVVHMEVPCCGGFIQAARTAVQQAGSRLPVRHITISRRGEILEEGADDTCACCSA